MQRKEIDRRKMNKILTVGQKTISLVRPSSFLFILVLEYFKISQSFSSFDREGWRSSVQQNSTERDQLMALEKFCLGFVLIQVSLLTVLPHRLSK